MRPNQGKNTQMRKWSDINSKWHNFPSLQKFNKMPKMSLHNIVLNSQRESKVWLEHHFNNKKFVAVEGNTFQHEGNNYICKKKWQKSLAKHPRCPFKTLF